MSELAVKLWAATLPKLTEVAPLKLVPVIDIHMPTLPDMGENVVIVGAGIKIKPDLEAVPPEVVTLIAPEEPAPTFEQ